jgi:hypothetical protein
MIDVLPAISLRLPLLRAGRIRLPHSKASPFQAIEMAKGKCHFIFILPWKGALA